MGYYSTFSFNLHKVIVDKEKIKEVETYFSDYEKKDVVGFCDVKLPAEESNGKTVLKNIEPDDYCGKFYDDRVFAEKLQGVIKEGTVQLSFVGEDGSTWGYELTPDRIIELDGVFVPTGFRRAYCKNCGVLIGYVEEETLKRLGNVCDSCAEK